MPDYTKTIIYVIRCLTLGVIECYVGSTINFTSRKNGHHNACINVKNSAHNYKLYKFIRDNGGWENWEMVMLEQYPECSSKIQKLIREREVADRLGAKLNTIRAFRSNEEKLEQTRLKNKRCNPLYNATPIICACGKSFFLTCKNTHIKTKHHRQYNPSV